MKRFLLFFLYAILAIILLVVGFVTLVATTTWGQNFVTRQVNNYLATKLKTPFKIGRIGYHLPDWIELENIYFETPKGDTLVAGRRIYVNMDMMALLKSRVSINEVEMEQIRLNLNRTLPDTTFNFQFLIDAFDTGAPPTPADTAAAPLDINLSAILLKDVRIRYRDDVVGADANIYLDSLRSTFDKTNLDRSQYHVNNVALDGLAANVRLYQGIDLPETASASATPASDSMDLALGSWKVNRVRWDVRVETADFSSKGSVGQLNLETDYFYLNGQKVGLRSLSLANSDIAAVLEKTTQQPAAKAAPAEPASAEESAGWQVILKQTQLANNRIRFDDRNAPVQKTGIDFGHLDIQNFSLNGQDIVYSPSLITAKIRQGRFQDKSGFGLKQFNVDAIYGEKMASLSNLYVQTGRSILRDRVVLRYDSLAQLSALTNPKVAERVRIDLSLRQSSLAVSDILQLAPFLADTPPFPGNRDAFIRVNARSSGTLANLNIPVFELAAFSGTRMVMKGRIRNVMDVDRIALDLTITDAATNRSDLNKLLPKGTLPDSFNVAPHLRLSGRVAGGLNNINADARLQTDWGNVLFDGTLKGFMAGKNEAYKGNMVLQNFNVGKWIGQEANIGEISADATFDGRGIDVKTMETTFRLNVSEAVLNRYRYQRFNAQGQLSRGNLTVRGGLDDPNARIALNAVVGLNTEYPSIQGELALNELNVTKLGFYEEPLSVKGRFMLDFASTDPNQPNGSLIAQDAVINYQNEAYPIDSLYLLARTNGTEKLVKAALPFGQLSLSGSYDYTRLYDLVAGEINRYFSIPDLKYKPVSEPYHFTLASQVHNHPLIQAFVPGLTRMDTVKFDAYIDNRLDTTMIARLKTGTIEYDTTVIQNVTLNMLAVENQLSLDGRIGGAKVNDMNISLTELSATAAENQLNFRVVNKDSVGGERHGLAGKVALKDSNYVVRFNAEGLLTNYHFWQSDTTGFIQYGKAGLLADHFRLRSGQQEIAINSTEPKPNAPIRVELKDIDLGDMARLANQDTTLAAGTLNGDVELSDYMTALRFKGEVSIDSLEVMQKPIGTLTAQFTDVDQRINVNAGLAGPYNQVNVTGFYNPENPNQALDFKVDLQRLDTRTVEAFSFGELRDAKGGLTGNFNITGSTEAPTIDGQVKFDSVGFTVAQINAPYLINDETITFDNQTIRLNQFDLIDGQGRKLTTDGTVSIKNIPDVSYDLRVRANNFQVLNAGRKDNDYAYGNAAITTNLLIRGTGSSPSVSGDIRLEDGSRVNIVLPDMGPSVDEAKQTVFFIDHKDTLSLQKYLMRPKVDTTDTKINFQALSNGNISLNLEATDKSDLTIIIDELNGDNLHAKGNAKLTLGMNAAGDMTLLGTYDVTEGEYSLTYQVLKREFSIQKGSQITWTGDPLKAILNIKAVYEATTAPENLIANESTSQLSQAFRQKLPFEVVLGMEGSLASPKLSFDIQLPKNQNYIASDEVKKAVEDKLIILRQDQSQINKQVFALLVLGNFISESSSSFFSGSGESNSTELLVLNSVSKVLSDQLEKFASNVIKGVDVNFNLMSQNAYTSNSGGTRTDLNVGLSKSFMDGRLTVSVGRNFELQNNSGINRNPNEVFDNLSLNYSLTSDGRYAVRAYRNSAYDSRINLDGYVIETGLAFAITVDYNLFRELFQKQDKKNL